MCDLSHSKAKIADILFELKSQQACLEVAAEGGATRYPAFLTGGQPAGAVSRMAERPNKRQRSPTHRDDASLDRNPDPKATYVPVNLSSNIRLLRFYNLLPFVKHLCTYCLSQRRQAAFDCLTFGIHIFRSCFGRVRRQHRDLTTQRKAN